MAASNHSKSFSNTEAALSMEYLPWIRRVPHSSITLHGLPKHTNDTETINNAHKLSNSSLI